jgi:Putative Actinobacterial Holin-X, holin superfamily III
MSSAAASGTPPEPAGAGSMWQQLQQLLRELPHLLSDRVDLLALELERAGRALARIVVLVVAGAVLAVTAWLAAWVVVFMALLAIGLSPIGALALVLMFNALAAWLAFEHAQKLVGVLSLPATRRHLTVSPAKQAPRESPHEHPVSQPAGAAGR